MSASMTLLASSHRHVADVGGTCCWQSGSEAWHGIGQARWWHAGAKDEGAVTFSSQFLVAINLLRSKRWHDTHKGGAGPTDDTAGVAAMYTTIGAGVAYTA